MNSTKLFQECVLELKLIRDCLSFFLSFFIFFYTSFMNWDLKRRKWLMTRNVKLIFSAGPSSRQAPRAPTAFLIPPPLSYGTLYSRIFQ